MSAQTQQRRRQRPAPGQESAIVAGRTLTFFAGRDELGDLTFRISFGRIGGSRRERRGAGRKPGGDTRATGGQRRGRASEAGAPTRSERGRTRAAMRATARVLTAPGRLLKRGWTAIRHRAMPGPKLTPKEQTEVKKFKYIGWAGLAPGVIGTAVTLGATAAGSGPLAPVIGLGASSVAAAINAPIQGYISAMLTRRLDRGTMGDTVDRTQTRAINRLTRDVETLSKQNDRLSRQVNKLQRQIDGKGTGTTAPAKSRTKGAPAKTNTRSAPAKQTGRGDGTGTRSGRTGNTKGERSPARPAPKKQPRSR